MQRSSAAKASLTTVSALCSIVWGCASHGPAMAPGLRPAPPEFPSSNVREWVDELIASTDHRAGSFFATAVRGRRDIAGMTVDLKRGESMELELDGAGRLTRLKRGTNRSGSSDSETTYAYDAQGLVVSIVEETADSYFHPETNTTQRSYSSGRLAKETVSSTGQQGTRWMAYEYDGRGRIVSLTFGRKAGGSDAGSRSTARHDDKGRLIALDQDDGRGHQTFEYDGAGRLVAYSPSEGQRWQFEYLASGALRKATHHDDYTSNTRRTFWITWDARGLPEKSSTRETDARYDCSYESRDGLLTGAICNGERAFFVEYRFATR